MTNKEIQLAIEGYQKKIQESFVAGNFQLNAAFMKYKKEIDKLRKQCTHQDEEGNTPLFNGRCVYCGTKLK